MNNEEKLEKVNELYRILYPEDLEIELSASEKVDAADDKCALLECIEEVYNYYAENVKNIPDIPESKPILYGIKSKTETKKSKLIYDGIKIALIKKYLDILNIEDEKQKEKITAFLNESDNARKIYTSLRFHRSEDDKTYKYDMKDMDEKTAIKHVILSLKQKSTVNKEEERY